MAFCRRLVTTVRRARVSARTSGSLVDRRAGRLGMDVEIGGSGLEPGDLHDLIDQTKQPQPALAHDGGVVPITDIADLAVELAGDYLGKADDRVQRGAQLMADHAQERALTLVLVELAQVLSGRAFAGPLF
jgi:hypothetical protein